MCIPNESFTELLEFCYDHPRILILEGKEFSRKYGPTPPLILHTHAQPHTNTHTTTHPPTHLHWESNHFSKSKNYYANNYTSTNTI